METSTTTPTLLRDLFPIQAPDEVNPEDYRDGIFFGYPGLLNHPTIPKHFAQYPPGNIEQDVKWQAIILDALNILSSLTNDEEKPDTLLLPWAVTFGAGLMNKLESQNIKTIGVLPELGAGFTRHGDSALLYSNDAKKLKITLDESGASQVELYFPFSLLMLVGV